jgi:hypothetical protein
LWVLYCNFPWDRQCHEMWLVWNWFLTWNKPLWHKDSQIASCIDLPARFYDIWRGFLNAVSSLQ